MRNINGKEPVANAGDVRDVGSILGWKDPLEEGMATHSSILAWRIPWTEEPSGLQSRGSQESDTTEHMRTTKNSFVCGRIFQTPFLIIYSLLPE